MSGAEWMSAMAEGYDARKGHKRSSFLDEWARWGSSSNSPFSFHISVGISVGDFNLELYEYMKSAAG